MYLENCYKSVRAEKNEIEAELRQQVEENKILRNYLENINDGRENPMQIIESDLYNLRENVKNKTKEFQQEFKKLKELNKQKVKELTEQNKVLKADYVKLKNSIVSTINAFRTNDEDLEKFIQDLAKLEYETSVNEKKKNGFKESDKPSKDKVNTSEIIETVDSSIDGKRNVFK